MNANGWRWTAGVVLGICPAVCAIPPPWELEAMKAKADVIAVVETTAVAPVEGAAYLNRKASVTVVAVLKTDATSPDAEAKDRQLSVLFREAQPPKAAGGLVAMSMGDPGSPKFVAGERALVFLQRLKGKDALTVVCGRFGYIRLSANSDEEQQRVAEEIARCREWSEKIADEQLRKAMLEYYRQATAFAGEGKAGIRP
jgi:hypothetical protein